MESIKSFLESFHLDGLVSNSVFQIMAIAWMLVMVWKYLLPTKRLNDQAKLVIDAMINEAVRRAPPVEAKDPVDGVPFEVYRKDLWRMAEGELSIEEFVDIWRGRKVQKRPTEEELQALKEKTAKEKAEKRPMEEELRTGMGRAFLAEWEAHLENNDPTGFAELFLLNLNQGGEKCQQFHARFTDFMKTRTWDQVLKAIRPAAKNPTPFLCGRAMWFYAAFQPKVIYAIEAYWNQFITPKSGHVHQWEVVPPIYGGVRLKCACGEVQEGQVGTQGPTCAVGIQLMGPTGPYGVSGVGYLSGVTGPGYSSGVTGIYQPQRGTHGPADCQSMAGPRGVQGYQKFKVGQWVRVTRLTSPAFGQIGRINWVMANEIRVLVESKGGDSFLVGVSLGEFESALPKVGEWWRRLECGVHQGLDSSQVLVGPDCEWWLSPNRLEDWNCGCIEPVNYGRGMLNRRS